ncbi:hypothetical protein GCM10027059_19530 [Myceligenerans halotolerans]
MWSDDDFRQAVSSTSTDLAGQIQAILDGRVRTARRVRRAARALARYAIRYAHRAAPFGYFAGVASVGFGEQTYVRFGGGHRVVTRVEPQALDEAVSAWEADPEQMAGVEVCVNNLARMRGGRLHVPSEGADEFTLALTPALRLVLEAASSPIGFADLSEKLGAEFPEAPRQQRHALLTELLRVRVLRSSLRAPATVTVPTDVLPPSHRDAHGVTTRLHDLRLDASIRLPQHVVTEAETAATVLSRLSPHPGGIPEWRGWIDRFTERYGTDTDVPLNLVLDPDAGVGFPEGFTAASSPPRVMTRRDRLLLDLAGTAGIECARSVELSEAMITELEDAADEPGPRTPHLEIAVQVHARSVRELDQGRFRLQVATVSRSAGSMTGRFWHLFPGMGAAYRDLPTVEAGAELAQLSFHPARVSADLLTRAPQVLPRVVSLGEHRRPGKDVLTPADLSVGVREGRPYLAETATGRHLELFAPTALNFLWNNYTPPLARFLVEISRATTPQVTWFDWAAAWTLPFTPALHYRRSILTAARWKIRARDLPRQAASLDEWATQLHRWKDRIGVPNRVLLAEDDQQLPLDLHHDMHLDLLRAHLNASRQGVAVLYDAPPPEADAWIAGRAHNIVIPLRARS